MNQHHGQDKSQVTQTGPHYTSYYTSCGTARELAAEVEHGFCSRQREGMVQAKHLEGVGDDSPHDVHSLGGNRETSIELVHRVMPERSK
jgi:hypothetical protein